MGGSPLTLPLSPVGGEGSFTRRSQRTAPSPGDGGAQGAGVSPASPPPPGQPSTAFDEAGTAETETPSKDTDCDRSPSSTLHGDHFGSLSTPRPPRLPSRPFPLPARGGAWRFELVDRHLAAIWRSRLRKLLSVQLSEPVTLRGCLLPPLRLRRYRFLSLSVSGRAWMTKIESSGSMTKTTCRSRPLGSLPQTRYRSSP